MKSPFFFRRLSEKDLPMLVEWLRRPHVAEIWDEQPDLPEAREKYLPRMSNSSQVRPFIGFRGGQPMGYIQSYVAVETEDGWWPGQHDRGVLGIDLFLSDGDELGKGVGTSFVRAFVQTLFQDPAIRRIQVDPAPDNPRAIRCYEKVGFREISRLTTPDGPAVLMVLDREGWV